jgi:hypothetical protein
LSWDAGLVPVASLGDFVWLDANANGVQDGGEPGIENVTVELRDCAGNVLASTTTAANGSYLFSGLTPGDYKVRFTKPPGYAFSPADQGANDAADSDANPVTGETVCTTLAPGETDLTWDAGLYVPASLGDFVWHDLNANGIQDAGEPGVEGVKVELLDCAGNVLAVTSTDPDGLYRFSGLVPGVYNVRFVPHPVFGISPMDQGSDDAKDSDANPTTGETACTTLESGENDLTWDAGLYQSASIGDFVWHDLNGNGIQDAGEPGVPNVTVNLLDCAGNVLATTTTDANGLYLFSGLVPGRYNVQVVAPTGTTFSPQDQGGDDLKDSDADATGMMVCTVLTSGENDLSWDAGLIEPREAPGTGTPGYWVNHPEAWPVDSITVGGIVYTKAQAIAMMKAPVAGDKRLTMFPALVCAMLNVMIGNDDSCIADTIDAANGWWATYSGKPVKASSYAWQGGGGNALYTLLDAYNNGLLPCAQHRD